MRRAIYAVVALLVMAVTAGSGPAAPTFARLTIINRQYYPVQVRLLVGEFDGVYITGIVDPVPQYDDEGDYIGVAFDDRIRLVRTLTVEARSRLVLPASYEEFPAFFESPLARDADWAIVAPYFDCPENVICEGFNENFRVRYQRLAAEGRPPRLQPRRWRVRL